MIPTTYKDLGYGIKLIGEGDIRRPSLFIGLLYYKISQPGWRKVVEVETINGTGVNGQIEVYDNGGWAFGTLQMPIASTSERAYNYLYNSGDASFPGEPGCPPIPEPLQATYYPKGSICCQRCGNFWQVWETGGMGPSPTRMIVENSGSSETANIIPSGPINNNGRSTCLKCGGPTRDVIGCISIIGQVCDICGI